jgi:hypothetical protein
MADPTQTKAADRTEDIYVSCDTCGGYVSGRPKGVAKCTCGDSKGTTPEREASITTAPSKT